jgi:hypothetical protein
MADEVPAKCFAAEFINLLGEFLDATFAEKPLAGPGSFAQSFCRVEFRYCDKLNIRGQGAADCFQA